MSKKSTDDTFLARWLSGDLTPEEEATFAAREDAELLRKIAETSAELEPPQRDQAASWEALQQKVRPAKKPARVRRLGNWWRYAAAAAVLLLAVYYVALPDSQSWTTISAPLAEKTVVELPDGSEVWLNAGSELRYQSGQFNRSRLVELKGEAFFDVVPGASFEVSTTQGTVSVLGTTFDVYARLQQFRVACYSGKVGVEYSTEEPQEILEPGQLIEVKEDEMSRGSIDAAKEMPEWTSGLSEFNDADFKTVIEELERQYAIQVNYPAHLDTLRGYNGGFPHRALESALQIVFSSVDCQYRIDDKVVDVFQSTD
ncbi:MAG: FecR domain-containing protein [Bacteroidota bacterium]